MKPYTLEGPPWAIYGNTKSPVLKLYGQLDDFAYLEMREWMPRDNEFVRNAIEVLYDIAVETAMPAFLILVDEKGRPAGRLKVTNSQRPDGHRYATIVLKDSGDLPWPRFGWTRDGWKRRGGLLAGTESLNIWRLMKSRGDIEY